MKAFLFFIVMLGLLTLSGCATVTTQFHFNHSTQFSSIEGAATPSVPSLKSIEVAPPLPRPAATPLLVSAPIITMLNPDEVSCMAHAIYFEARGESERGQIAVGQVVLNRTHDKRFPDSVCGVVHQGLVRNGRIVRGKCQFAWYCDGRSDTPKNPVAYARAVELAKLVLLKVAPNPVGNSLFFHGRTAKRRAARYYAETHRIGNHFFYAYVAKI